MLTRLVLLFKSRFHDWRFYSGIGIWLFLWIVEGLLPSHDLKHVLTPIGQLLLLSVETFAISLLVIWVFENLFLPNVEFEEAWKADGGINRTAIGLIYVAIALVIAAFIRGFLLPF